MSASKEDAFFQYHLKTEAFEDKYGPAVMLTQQDDINEPATIVMHPWQLRAACEYLGILHADPVSAGMAARLTRRLRVLTERIDQLNEYLQAYGATEYVNLKFEQAYSQATADLAAEFVTELEESRPTEPEQGVLL